MKTIIVTTCATLLLMAGLFAQDSHPQTSADQVMHMHHAGGESNGTAGTITGYVRDIACLLRNPKAGAATTPLTQDCLQKCVRGGSSIGMLTEEVSLYLPYVKASGKLFERGGLHAISVEKSEVIGRPVGSKIPTL